MAVLGAHMSTAGGAFRAVERAKDAGCDCVQLFSKNNNQWAAKPLTDEDVSKFKNALKTLGIASPLVHDSYLINLAAPDDTLLAKSVAAFGVELDRCEQLGVPWLVFHPGAATDGDEQAGLDRVVASLDALYEQRPTHKVRALIETTAGQGTTLGWKFEHLAYILDNAKHSKRLGVCVDTCHIFAAGYAYGTESEYQETFGKLDELVGLKRVLAFHINDSKKGKGSRVDRHEHIGEGMLGAKPFELLMNDKRFAKTPMYLETPKGERDGEDLDKINLATLRGYIG